MISFTRIFALAAIVATAAPSYVSAADTPPSAPPVSRPTSVGGGVKKPWTPPYVLALVVPEPASVSLLAVGAAALIIRRRRR